MEQMFNTSDGYEPALTILRAGGLVAVPTETVYGLAADATNSQAVARIYAAKGRPQFNPLIAHVSGLDMARRVGQFDDLSLELAEKFWPGPLTLVVPVKTDASIADAVTAGLGTIALRQPSGIMAKLAEGLSAPLAAPSANSSGRISPTLAKHVAEDLGDKVDIILDDGPCRVGVESTIVKVVDDSVVLLRQGGLAVEDIEAVVGKIQREPSNPKIEAPGMLLAHYAPALPLRLNAEQVEDDEALISFGTKIVGGHPHTLLNLSPDGDLEEAARNLFAMIKELDACGARGIAVQPIPSHGLGAAINDRLKRAAHGSENGNEKGAIPS